ncbi:ATP-binding cassette domain-containing protein [Agromyces sp. MMS17-SY077]|uniref:ATP-binding cassette domain-containing protein n=2 Tax=Agromyces seonyuensis TaxID=2662446 RepID=A0A6I4P0L6_9MICO|nr:ABC transporter ATP-binding protein [Agromyces seonyuensis]MWB99901.1 ATP-binding cassette domain-containing protein [Agromyces seonyuensis]
MRYGAREVLAGLDLRIHRGEVVALLGPNGAGKTTTIELLEGFRRPTSGTVRVLGEDPARAGDDWRARVGVVLQSWRDHARWKVGPLLEQFAALYAGVRAAGRPAPYDVDELLGLVGLAAQRGALVKSLSGGQRRRLDVAIGLVGRPELLFLDEPTVGFDPVARHDFHELVNSLSDFDETTVLLTTHDLAEAEKIASRILILDRGRIVADGSPIELSRQAAGESEVAWREGGRPHVHATADPVAFLRELLARPGAEITELQVRAQTLEETYLAMVARHDEAAGVDSAAAEGEMRR